jgi:hypothetical protein
MMIQSRKVVRCALVALAVVALQAAASAAPVLLSDQQLQTVTGQTFVFSFTGVPGSDGTAGSLTINARGDYSVNFPNIENLELFVDGVSQGTFAPGTADSYVEYAFDDVEWTDTIGIPGVTMQAVTADSQIDIVLDLDDNVHLFGNLVGVAYAGVDLAYNSGPEVPMPAALPLGAVLLGGMFITRRRTGRTA